MLWNVIAVICIVVATLAGYVYWQYRTAAPLALGSIPIYAESLAVPTTDVPEPQRRDAETQLRNIAASAYPDYKVADERFLATKEPFTWDAVRHHIGYFLTSRDYVRDRDDLSSDNAVAYLVYGHDGWWQEKFNSDKIVVAGFMKPTLRTGAGEPAHFYGYFRLARS